LLENSFSAKEKQPIECLD